MLTTFDEVLLDLGYDYGYTGGPEFNTVVVVSGSGREQRRAAMTQHRGRWDIGSQTMSGDRLHYIVSFFNARMGRLIGFRWRDLANYIATNQATQQLDSTRVQLGLQYGDYFKKISKPTAGVSVFVNGVEDTGAVVDTTTGVVTLSNALAVGDVVTWSGEYHIPVRFNTDTIRYKFENYEDGKMVFSVGAIEIIEILV